ncbi:MULTISPECIES: hypothetical protein [Prauserella]|uniref:Uncharacterized protein n=1 Tax=Prauserella endophytica TaxID=1592324 RepID=A0ABY2S3F9_9PSEU|nr:MULTISPECIES: hypothetical protein [Prauserella]TKG69250.1 hypothetical protein FCN18_20910 [Prauserella endophytica]
MLRNPHWGNPAAWARASAWLTFASILPTLTGVFHVIVGLVALLRADYYVCGRTLCTGTGRRLTFRW